ncbi:MAG TPA: hypothetical protein DDX06_14790 [Curvibacter sp.]|nr:hypothetical protein [Curvibacter sp.]
MTTPRLPLPRWLQRAWRAGRLAPELISAWAQWIEALLIPTLAVALAWFLLPQDPLQTRELFPWVWFAPTLVALRYGVSPGLLSCVPLIASWYLAEQSGRLPASFGLEYFFGGGLLVLICGEFSDIWRDRNLRLEESNVYLAERLSRITKRHLLLNLSHDRLEHEMLTRPSSLRDALVHLRGVATTGEPGQAMPGAERLLQLLAQYVNVEAATLYTLVARGDQHTLGHAVAQLGEPLPLQPEDELLRLALQQQQLAHIASQELSLNRQTDQLVVAPLVAGSGRPLAVLAVTRMPFFALNVEHLQMMSVILSYYADTVHNGPAVTAIQQRLPGMPPQFAEELACMQGLQARTGMGSQILVMRFEGEQGRAIPAEFLRVKRGLDVYWQTTSRGHPVVAVLMPLASPAAMAGFTQRIEQWLEQRFQGSPDTLGVRLLPIDFAHQDPVDALARLLAG